MSSTKLSNRIYETLDVLFPDARCELNYNNLFELIVSVVLSAQTTDKRVNEVTKVLFSKYPTSSDLASALPDDVSNIIRPIGLTNSKTKNIIALAKALEENFNGNVPNNVDDLTSLPGVGIKTASVVLVEGYKIPAVPVDTHVFRVCHRLGISDGKTVTDVANDIKDKFDENMLCRLHILLIFFGRYMCKAINPLCENCPFKDICKK